MREFWAHGFFGIQNFKTSENIEIQSFHLYHFSLEITVPSVFWAASKVSLQFWVRCMCCFFPTDCLIWKLKVPNSCDYCAKTWLSFASSAGIHCFQSTSHSQVINTFSTQRKPTAKRADPANLHCYKQFKALRPYIRTKYTHFTLHTFNSNCNWLDLVDYLGLLSKV